MSGRGESPVADVIKLFSVVIHTSAERSWHRSQKKRASLFRLGVTDGEEEGEKVFRHLVIANC